MARAAPGSLVWDLPTRLFHWSLVALLGFSWWSAENDHMDWHLPSGLAVCGLVLFRLLWGFIGTPTARFSQFVRGPREIWRYLRPPVAAPRVATVGHDPLGALSVLALLAAVAVQVVSGLFAVDVDGIESGPLSVHVDFDQGRVAAAIHHTGFDLLLALAGLHVLAILFYLVVRRRNLVSAMVTGRHGEAATGISAAAWWRFAIAAALSGLAVWRLADGGW